MDGVILLEKGRISARQFMLLVFMYSLGTSIIVNPSLTAYYASMDAWITCIISSIIGVGIVFLLIRVSSMDEKKNLFELMEFALGKFIGKVVILLFLFFMLFLTATNLRQIGDFMTTQIMVDTPIQFIMLLFALTSLYGIKLGLEVIGRSCEIFFPYAIVSLILLLVLVSPEADFTKIKPILEDRASAAFATVIPTLGIPYFELIVFLAIIPYVNAFKKAKKGFYIGTIVASFMILLITLMCLAVLGAEFTGRQVYPTYILGKKISIANFLERIEILVAIAWFFTIFFKITVNFYVLSLGFSHFFKLKNVSTLSTPLSFILIILGLISYPNIIYYQEMIAYYWVFFAATMGLCLPLVILIVGKIRQKKKE